MANRSPQALREQTSKNTHATVASLLYQEPQVRTVLDLPCGEGAFTARILERGYDVVAADCIDVCRLPGTPFTPADMNQPLPWESDSFDAVVCIDGIEHIERPFDFVTECRRILRPGGIMILSTPNISALRSRWRWFLTGFHNKGKTPLDEAQPLPHHHINLIAFPKLRYLLHRTGFRLTAIAANRIKPVSWLYAPLVPLAYGVTRRVFHAEEHDPHVRRQNHTILRQMFSRAVLFGEILIVKAMCGETDIATEGQS